MTTFFGKYRGVVINNEDPLEIGRLQVMVPRVLGDVVTAWAMPCVPYAGLEQGFCFTPPIDAGVWVEFEGGDPDYPIWSGCYWREGERPAEAVLPSMRLLKTEFGTLMMNDTPGEGGFTLSTIDPAVATPISITANSEGLTIRVAVTSIQVTDVGITLMADPALIQMGAAGITIAHGSAMINASEPEVVINEGSLTVL